MAAWGKMVLKNDNGDEFEYKVRSVNGHVTLIGKNGSIYELIEDTPEKSIQQLESEISELELRIEEKKKIIKEIKEGLYIEKF